MAKSKKDISKEAMFSKIMPTGSSSHTVAPNVKLARPYDPEVDERERKIEEMEKEENTPELTDEEKELDAYAEKLGRRKEAQNDKEDSKEASLETADEIIKAEEQSRDSQGAVKTVMVNIREKMVLNKLDEAMEKFNCCTCYFCRQDITTATLNNLKPKYVVTLEEDIDKIISTEDYSEVTQALMKAILQVKTHPRH